MSNSRQKPVEEIRVGRVRAAIWENETKNGARHNVTFSRLYRDDNGDWHDSTSFGRDDLLLLSKVADRAHSWIIDHLLQAHSESKETRESAAPF